MYTHSNTSSDRVLCEQTRKQYNRIAAEGLEEDYPIPLFADTDISYIKGNSAVGDSLSNGHHAEQQNVND